MKFINLQKESDQSFSKFDAEKIHFPENHSRKKSPESYKGIDLQKEA